MSINKLYKCIEKKKVYNSQAREAIYRFLMSEHRCLSVSIIMEELSSQQLKNISHTTVYRHLNFFVECGLVIAFQNHNKASYFCLAPESPSIFSICPKCSNIEKIGMANLVTNDNLENSEFIAIHKKCKKCKL